MSTRTQLAAQLQTKLGPTYDVLAFDRNLGPIAASTPDGEELSAVVVVDAPTFSPAPEAGSLALTFKLHVITPYTDAEKVADAFDTVLEDVFAALDSIGNAVWSEASPAMYDEQKPSYVIQLTIRAQKG